MTQRLAAAAVVGWCLILQLSVTAAPKSPKRDEQRENEAVAEARRDLQDAQDDLKQAEKKAQGELRQWQQAVEELRQATARLSKVREQLEGEHAEITGLGSARSRLQQVTEEISRRSPSVLSAVVEQNAELRKQIAELEVQANQEGDLAARRAAIKALPDLRTRWTRLEEAALASHPETTTLVQQQKEARQEVQRAGERFEKAVETAPQWRDAQSSVTKARRDAERMEESADQALQQSVRARQRVAKARQHLEQKELQDRRDSNRPKPKKNN